jgi:tripartite-type tricarboxylate transporter receptor subunit TctC
MKGEIMKRLVFSLCAAALALAAAGAPAQDRYPSRAVKLVVPFPAAGPVDLLARIVSQKLNEQWGQPVVVENKAGATGGIGAGAVAKAPPDGYTLLFTVELPLTMLPVVAKDMSYDPRADFVPIAGLTRSDNVLFAHPSAGADTVAELIARAKAQPGKLTFASAGPGSPAHLGGELFKIETGVDMTHVPYKGAAPAMNALLAGEVQLFFGPIPQGLPHVRAGKIKALAMTGTKPSPLMPEVKPFVALGYPTIIVSTWYGALAPKGTPATVIEKVRDGLRKVMDDAEVRGRLGKVGLEVEWMDGPELARAIDADLRRWSAVGKKVGLKAN